MATTSQSVPNTLDRPTRLFGARLGLSIFTASLALSAWSAFAAEEIPSHPDKLVPKPFTYVPPAPRDFRTVLKAGPVVYIAEDRELPLVNIAVTVRTGTYQNPPGKEGLAELTGYLLSRGGAGKRKAEELDERLAFLAANVTSAVGDDRGTVSINLLSKDLDEGLALLREMLAEPRFQEDKLVLRKEQLLNDMKARNDDSAAIEARERNFLTLGEGFYVNRHATKASLDAITRADLVAFHKRVFDPRNFIVAAAGDFRRAELVKKLESLFAKWPHSSEAAQEVPKPSHTLPKGLFIVDKDVNQGRVSVFLPGVKRDDPDFFAMQLMNDILGGGGFTSRITNRVRSDEGLAYSAGSALLGGVYYPGTFRAAFQSKVRTCAYATQIVLEEMKKMREFGEADGKASEEELSTSKKSFIETLPRRFSTKAATMNVLLDEEFTGRYKSDPDFFAQYRARVLKVTVADVKRVAQRLLDPQAVAILAVGKKDDLLNPDPKHPVPFVLLSGGKLVDVPLRDPMTMKPIERK